MTALVRTFNQEKARDCEIFANLRIAFVSSSRSEPHGGGGKHVGDGGLGAGLVAAVLAQLRHARGPDDEGQPVGEGDVLHAEDQSEVSTWSRDLVSTNHSSPGPHHGPRLLVHAVPVPVGVQEPQLASHSGSR